MKKSVPSPLLASPEYNLPTHSSHSTPQAPSPSQCSRTHTHNHFTALHRSHVSIDVRGEAAWTNKNQKRMSANAFLYCFVDDDSSPKRKNRSNDVRWHQSVKTHYTHTHPVRSTIAVYWCHSQSQHHLFRRSRQTVSKFLLITQWLRCLRQRRRWSFDISTSFLCHSSPLRCFVLFFSFCFFFSFLFSSNQKNK